MTSATPKSVVPIEVVDAIDTILAVIQTTVDALALEDNDAYALTLLECAWTPLHRIREFLEPTDEADDDAIEVGES